MIEGSEETALEGQFQIIISFRADPWEITVDGNVTNGDMALAMLDQVRRKVEQDMRLAASIQAQMEMRKKIEEESRVQSILGRNRPQ